MKILKLLTIILLILSTTNCGHCSKNVHLNSVFREVLDILPMNDDNVCSIGYSNDLGDSVVGTATTTPWIQCDILIIRGLPPIVEKAVMAHEMLHCLGIEHSETDFDIMNAYLPPTWYLEKHEAKLYKDLLRYFK